MAIALNVAGCLEYGASVCDLGLADRGALPSPSLRLEQDGRNRIPFL